MTTRHFIVIHYTNIGPRRSNWWRFGLVVTSLGRSTKLLYVVVEPG